jgi:predicted RNA-binding Zn ribbon-like protein
MGRESRLIAKTLATVEALRRRIKGYQEVNRHASFNRLRYEASYMAVAGGNELVSLIGGRLALDFANAGSPKRRLSWEELISFLEATKVISAERTAVLLELPESEPMAAHALLEHGSSFRDVLRQTFRGMLHKEIPKPEAVEAINELLRVTEGHDELRSDAGRWRIEFVARESGLEWLLAAIARSAAEIVAEGGNARIRVCANSECGLFFYDASRTKKRRWCAMAVCGNRHKVASFAKKHGPRASGR